MARTKKEYISKAKTVSIRFTSRASTKIRDNYYTVEACEERIIPDVPDIDIEMEKKLLWDSVNSECDKQIDDIWQEFKERRKK